MPFGAFDEGFIDSFLLLDLSFSLPAPFMTCLYESDIFAKDVLWLQALTADTTRCNVVCNCCYNMLAIIALYSKMNCVAPCPGHYISGMRFQGELGGSSQYP